MARNPSMSDWIAPIYDLPAVLPDMAWAGHIPFLQLLIHIFEPKSFVELGVFNGTSFLAGCEASRKYGTSTACVGIDTWKGDPQLGYYNGDMLFQNLSALVAERYPGSRIIRSTFDDAVDGFDEGSIDLLHIDGLHTYDAVSHDFHTWKGKLTGRSVVLFHDTGERQGDFGVWKFWGELVKSGSYRTLEFFHSHGLGVLACGDHAGTSFGALLDFAEEGKNEELLRVVCEVAGATLPGRLERQMRGGRQDVEVTRESPAVATASAKPGRNSPCPCGSGKKYKHCHGA